MWVKPPHFTDEEIEPQRVKQFAQSQVFSY